MSDYEEIVNKADALEVHPTNVQRDYVFGWVLAGIYTASDLSNHLVLKGGNCLRKAYFESARNSPDLDFATATSVTADYIRGQLSRVCQYVEANSEVQFDLDRIRVDEKPSADRAKHIQMARLYFHDFFGAESDILISIKLDISELERIILPVATRSLIHPYSDQSACTARLKCLKLEEMLASKLKCLIQRRHSADMYDFVNATLVSPTIEINQGEVVSTFLKMTIFGPGPRAAKDILLNLPFEIIRALWDKYVVCPRLSFIDFDRALDGFRKVIDSLFGALPPMSGELAFFPAHLRSPIMEAGYTMTTLRVVYDGVLREVEPYSLKYKTRKDGVGQDTVYVYDLTGGPHSGPGIKSWPHGGFQTAENTGNHFEPRYEVELSKAGQFFQEQYFHTTPGRGRWISWRQSSHRYTVECQVCGKHFYRDTYSLRLNPHKDRYGSRCFGKTGFLL